MLGSVRTLSETSMMQGVQQLFKGYDDKAKLANLGYVLEGMPAQFVPTFANQLRMLHDNERRIVSDPNLVSRVFNRIIYKMPFVNDALPRAYQTLGYDMPAESFQNGTNTLANVFFNPGFATRYAVDPSVQLFLDAYDHTGKQHHLPNYVSRKFSIGKSRINDAFGREVASDALRVELTGEDRSELQRLMARLTWKAVTSIDQSQWAAMDPDMQMAILVKAVNSASEQTQKWFVRNRARKYPEFSAVVHRGGGDLAEIRPATMEEVAASGGLNQLNQLNQLSSLRMPKMR